MCKRVWEDALSSPAELALLGWCELAFISRLLLLAAAAEWPTLAALGL